MEERNLSKGMIYLTQNKPLSKREAKQAQFSTNTLKVDT
jgi:hypothetical protein